MRNFKARKNPCADVWGGRVYDDSKTRQPSDAEDGLAKLCQTDSLYAYRVKEYGRPCRRGYRGVESGLQPNALAFLASFLLIGDHIAIATV